MIRGEKEGAERRKASWRGRLGLTCLSLLAGSTPTPKPFSFACSACIKYLCLGALPSRMKRAACWRAGMRWCASTSVVADVCVCVMKQRTICQSNSGLQPRSLPPVSALDRQASASGITLKRRSTAAQQAGNEASWVAKPPLHTAVRTHARTHYALHHYSPVVARWGSRSRALAPLQCTAAHWHLQAARTSCCV